MPITAETFKVEHFEKLERGIAVAREAYAKLQEERDEEEQARRDAEERIADIGHSVEEATLRLQQWDRLLEFVADVERGVRSAEELFVFVREQSDQYDYAR